MLDKTDLRLLYELNSNCRQTFTALGKKLRVSKQVVAYRISQLEEKNIIRSYHALIDWRKLGYNAIRIYLKWHNIDPSVEQDIYEEIRNDPFFMWTAKFEGDFDIGFYLWVESIPDFSQKWFSFLDKYAKYILKQEIYESVTMVHYPMKVLSTEIIYEEKVIGYGKKQDYDNVDYEILKCVTRNAQISLVELGKVISLTPKAVLYRLKKMEKNGIILGYNAFLDTEQLGYQFYKIDFYLNDTTQLKEMFEFAKQHKNIVYRMRTIGGPGFEIEVMVSDILEMKNIVFEIKKRFSCVEYHRFHSFENIKQVYLPGEKI